MSMTRDPDRIDEVLEELEEYWKENPDLRLGQIIVNMSRLMRYDTDPFYIEDDELKMRLEEINDR